MYARTACSVGNGRSGMSSSELAGGPRVDRTDRHTTRTLGPEHSGISIPLTQVPGGLRRAFSPSVCGGSLISGKMQTCVGSVHIRNLASSGGQLVARLLLVVSRTQPTRYKYLKHVFASGTIDVMFDRRTEAGRQRQAPAATANGAEGPPHAACCQA